MRNYVILAVFALCVGAWGQSSSGGPAQNTPGSTPASAGSPSNTAPSNSPPANAPPSAKSQNSSGADNSQAAKPKTQDPVFDPPRSDRVDAANLPSGIGESSSKDTEVDLSPPANDAKLHPESSKTVNGAAPELADEGSISEFRPWDPHKASKDVEVGDFYFKRKNYKAAEDRYREALYYKDNDAIATFRLAECLEKMGRGGEARAEYESYLKILPHGPEVAEAQKAIERLKALADTKPAK